MDRKMNKKWIRKIIMVLAVLLVTGQSVRACDNGKMKLLTKQAVPSWVDTLPHNCFVGVSGRYATEKEARESAWQNAIFQVAAIFDISVNQLTTRFSCMQGNGAATRDTQVRHQSASKMATDVRLEGIKPLAWFTQKWQICDDGRWRIFYKVYVQVKMDECDRDRVRKELAASRKREDVFVKEIESHIRNGERALALRLIDTLHNPNLAQKLRARMDGVSHQFQLKATVRGSRLFVKQGIWEKGRYQATRISLLMSADGLAGETVGFPDGVFSTPVYRFPGDSCTGRFEIRFTDPLTKREWKFNLRRMFPWRVAVSLRYPKGFPGNLRDDAYNILKTNGLVGTGEKCSARHRLRVSIVLLKEGPDSLYPDFKVYKVQFTARAVTGGREVKHINEVLKGVKLSMTEARQLVYVAVQNKISALVDSLKGDNFIKTGAQGMKSGVSTETQRKIDRLKNALGGQK